MTVTPAVGIAVPAWAECLPGCRLHSVYVADAAALDAEQLSAAVADAYRSVLAGVRHPVRFWNFLPGINDAVDDRQTRYMAFNAGRLAAFADRPDARVATASAVGHGGADLAIHCLSADRPGTPVDNPRQIRPHLYSARYGPRPPCFARACRLGRHLFVGGTAAICGQDTTCTDLPGQVRETLRNVAVVAAGCRLTHVRVYHVPGVDVADLLPADWRPEFIVADVCRPSLLVEIEALAEVTA